MLGKDILSHERMVAFLCCFLFELSSLNNFKTKLERSIFSYLLIYSRCMIECNKQRS